MMLSALPQLLHTINFFYTSACINMYNAASLVCDPYFMKKAFVAAKLTMNPTTLQMTHMHINA